MTKRSPVSAIQNIWFDAQQVDDTDLTLEQQANSAIQSAIINNHIGTGILPEDLVPNVLFDSSLVVGFLDGIAIETQTQPSDNNYGNILEIELSDSNAAGHKAIKFAIIGLDFESNLQYETFYFKTNEIQVSKKHFTQILVLLFNDFIGDPDLSFNLGGKIVIREASPITLSRSPIMISQDIEPNLFFRDFFTDGSITLQSLLQNAMPLYNIDTLNIYTSEKDNKIILSDDVTTQIGQKFKASTDNIQKVTLLLSVQNQVIGSETDLVWNGDLIVSIYPLQSSIECYTDIAPNLPIDFAPTNIPLSQISINYASLEASGTILDSVPQPVDFVFSNSALATGNVLEIGTYYAVTIKRSGTANKCDILIAVGNDTTEDSRLTTFTGTLWVDIPEEDLWFQIWTDAAKISDGQAYESGNGIIIPKTYQDPVTLTTTDYSLHDLQFIGNDVFRAVISAQIEESVPVPDQRTGNPILSRQQFVPKIELLNSLEITNLEQASDPLITGAISDKNIKFYDSIPSTITSKLFSASVVDNEMLIKIVDDPTDAVRFDTSVNALVTNLLNGFFIGAKIYPDSTNTSLYYRVSESKLCSMIVGDVNGDGIVDQDDVDILNTYLDYNLNVGLPLDTLITTDTVTTTFTNGYTTYTSPFSNLFAISFQLIETGTGTVVESGTDGVLIANPNDNRLANFTSASVDFSTILALSDYKLVLLTPLVLENYGAFDITSIDSTSDVLTIRKVYLTGDVIGQLFRADIDGDFEITEDDGYLLQSYVDRNPVTVTSSSIYPGPTTDPYSKIGSRFNVIKFKVEKFVDRNDDYTSDPNNRATVTHPSQDIFTLDGYFAGHDFYNSPTEITVQKQLTWNEHLIVTNSKSKLVPSIFTSNSGFVENSCALDGVICEVYPSKPEFDPGKVDFFVPNNIIIGTGGEIQRADGEFYKVDFEVGTIVLEIPDGLLGAERTINIMDDFIVNYNGEGITRLGFPAMKFADCSYVSSSALTNDQLRFSVAVQSFSPNTSGLSDDEYGGVIVDGKMGVSIDYSTGLLTLNFTNLYQDEILRTLSTKIQVNVFLKKGGFNNTPLFVDSTKMQNMLSMISIFSGANVGGPSALVDLEGDVTGVLPIINGGLGLSTVGASGTVLMSNGSAVSYEFITTDNVGYTPTTPSDWNVSPTTLTEALDRVAALLKILNGGTPIP